MNEQVNHQPDAVTPPVEANLPRPSMSPEAREYALRAALLLGHHNADAVLASKEAELQRALADPSTAPAVVRRLEDEVTFYHNTALLVPEGSDYTHA